MGRRMRDWLEVAMWVLYVIAVGIIVWDLTIGE